MCSSLDVLQAVWPRIMVVVVQLQPIWLCDAAGIEHSKELSVGSSKSRLPGFHGRLSVCLCAALSAPLEM